MKDGDNDNTLPMVNLVFNNSIILIIRVIDGNKNPYTHPDQLGFLREDTEIFEPCNNTHKNILIKFYY